MVLHAGLDTTAAGLYTRAALLDIRFAGFDHSHTAQKGLLAGIGELCEVLRDARPDPAVARLNAGAMSLDLWPAGLMNR